LNVVKEELEEHVEGMREHLTAAVERMERRREQDFENQQRQIAELKRKVEAQHENGGYKRPCAAPTKQVRSGLGGICCVLD
jgi:hypothetical protein